MKFIIFKVIIAMVVLGLTQAALAASPWWFNPLMPYQVWLDCDPAQSMGNPPLEPYNGNGRGKGRGKAQEAYVGIEGGYCWKIEVKCDEGLNSWGGFLLGVDPFEGGGFTSPYIHEETDLLLCDGFMAFKSTSEFSQNCSFEVGEADLEVKLVEGALCSDLPPPTPVSDCFFDNGTPGCDCADCEALVCGMDSFCCDVAWDNICVNLAKQNCQGLCQ